jgi:four helix bundle protein
LAAESYRNLEVWKKAMALVTQVYQCSEDFPKSEYYGLRAQLRRSAVSVPSNIAEGKGRWSKREFELFLSHARGSLMEMETQLQIAVNLKYLSTSVGEDLLAKSGEVGRMLNGLRASLSRGPQE